MFHRPRSLSDDPASEHSPPGRQSPSPPSADKPQPPKTRVSATQSSPLAHKGTGMRRDDEADHTSDEDDVSNQPLSGKRLFDMSGQKVSIPEPKGKISTQRSAHATANPATKRKAEAAGQVDDDDSRRKVQVKVPGPRPAVAAQRITESGLDRPVSQQRKTKMEELLDDPNVLEGDQMCERCIRLHQPSCTTPTRRDYLRYISRLVKAQEQGISPNFERPPGSICQSCAKHGKPCMFTEFRTLLALFPPSEDLDSVLESLGESRQNIAPSSSSTHAPKQSDNRKSLIGDKPNVMPSVRASEQSSMAKLTPAAPTSQLIPEVSSDVSHRAAMASLSTSQVANESSSFTSPSDSRPSSDPFLITLGRSDAQEIMRRIGLILNFAGDQLIAPLRKDEPVPEPPQKKRRE
ncbi:hypothetical protein BDN70DRAFT_939655 [Pholiota conissans]|uniref:Uncharacterized protein n=1 Tax=Pholiota conissans TaxID=109636 RepID=A0A9P6CSE0_9AGAR|nr:hypothetical protein BDN70DRAFT_939655 [Pholiota conissans]